LTQKGQIQQVSQERHQARLQFIEQNILVMSQEDMAKILKVDRSTIKRDIKTWRDNGGMADFTYTEFFYQYGKARTQEKPIKLVDRLLQLIKTLPDTKQEQLEEQIKISFNLPQKYNLKTTKKTNKTGGVSYTQEAELKKIDLEEDKEKEEEET